MRRSHIDRDGKPRKNGLTAMTSLDRIASWVIRNRHTKEVICETFNPVDLMRLNTAKYEAVPILEYLQEFNRK